MAEKCPLCGSEHVKIPESLDGEIAYLDCPTCGKYIYPRSSVMLIDKRFNYSNIRQYDLRKLVTYLFYNKQEDRYAFIGTESAFSAYRERNPASQAFLVTPEAVENWYPKSFAEKIDRILLNIYNNLPYEGCKISIEYAIAQLFFCYSRVERSNKNEERVDDHAQVEYILSYLEKNEYIFLHDHNAYVIQLTPKALERIYELQKNQSGNKDVFVAMSFHPSANDIRNAIKKAIEDAKYSSLLMDEVLHNHQIVPEMLRLIKESRFMIMDITQPNFGAYYEAGYALGLGKEVIITCSQEVWDNKDFSCDKDKSCSYKERATKPHFDIAQKQVLRWKDYDDLTKQLTEWIRHIIG